MRLGDTGLVVDYIVSKLLSIYPEMDSGELVSWSPENVKYLKRYLQENMPEMLQMVNISGTAIPFSSLLYLNTEGVLSLTELNSIMNKDLVSTVGVAVDTFRGSPYDEYPLQIVSIPVEAGKNYRLSINYNDLSSKPINFTNPFHDWNLDRYSLVGVSKGRAIFENQKLQECLSDGGYRLISGGTPKNKAYISLGSSYAMRYDQTVQISSVDILKLTIPGGSTLGEFELSDGSIVKFNNEAFISYDNLKEEAYIRYANKDLVHILTKGEYIKLTNSSGLELTPSGTGESKNLKAEIQDLKIEIGRVIVSGIVVDTRLQVVGYGIVDIESPCTGRELIIGSNKWYIENDEMIGPTGGFFDEGQVVYMDGVEYTLTSTNNTITTPTPTKEILEQDYGIRSYKVHIPESETEEPEEVIGRTVRVNSEAEGYNLILQLPFSTVSYSLVEINENDDLKVDMSEFNEGSIVTSKYLDVILLDRTITKYSKPDDIEWLQQLSGFYNPSPTSDEIPNGLYLGVFDNLMRDKIKSIQENPPDHPTEPGLGRKTYITGWCDPETELLLELRDPYWKE